MELSLKEIIELIYKRLKLIIIFVLIGAGLLFVVNRFIRRPIYTASVQLYVNPNDTTPAANLNELNYAQKVVATYVNLLRTQKFYKKVLEETGLNYSESQLKNMTNIQSVGDTEIFKISVNSHSASDSYELVKAMEYIAPQIISEVKNNAKITVIDPVVFPTGPSGPNILLNTMIGALAGFFLAFTFAFLWELIDVKVKSKDDLMEKYQIPILGAIPSFNDMIPRKNVLLQKMSFLNRKKKKSNLNQMINEQANFIITEAYKALRINLLYTIRKQGCKKILINSPNPEEGKSTTCLNIGIALANAGAKVLLIDCDLRKGRLHKPLNVKSTPGLSNVLSVMKTDEEVVQDTDYENLQLIACGTIAPNPTELLSSIQMEELLLRLEKRYDYIILDSAPVNLVADALSLAKLVDGILMVVRENGTTYPNIDSALNKYELINGKLLGFVINGITFKQGEKSKSKYYYNVNQDD